MFFFAFGLGNEELPALTLDLIDCTFRDEGRGRKNKIQAVDIR